MFVYVSIKACNACGYNGSDLEQIVDVAIEDIKLKQTPVQCSCGYFYSYFHRSVSFSKWQVAVAHNSEDIKDVHRNITEYKATLSKLPSHRVQILLNNAQDHFDSLLVLKELYKNPIPDHLFDDFLCHK